MDVPKLQQSEARFAQRDPFLHAVLGAAALARRIDHVWDEGRQRVRSPAPLSAADAALVDALLGLIALRRKFATVLASCIADAGTSAIGRRGTHETPATRAGVPLDSLGR